MEGWEETGWGGGMVRVWMEGVGKDVEGAGGGRQLWDFVSWDHRPADVINPPTQATSPAGSLLGGVGGAALLSQAGTPARPAQAG